MTTAIAERPADSGAIEQALVGGDLARLTPTQRVSYYNAICQSLGLNPLTKPFAYITLNGKLTLYALKDCTEQLRSTRNVSVQIVAREAVEDCYVVTARASLPNQRQDESIGAVPLAGLKGEARANAMMKAETKAKRRVTLSICGLGMLDETEVDSIPQRGYTVEAPAAPALPDASSSNGKTSDLGSGDAGSIPADAPTPGALTIVSVEHRPTKNPNVVKYVVVLSDGREVTTIKTPLGNLAEQLCQDGSAVTVETKSSKWGEDLVALRRAVHESFLDDNHGRDHVADDDECPF